jgi:hypothetical protein
VQRRFFGLGLLLVLGYWLFVRPPGFGPLGYVEDLCADFVRQIMAQHIEENGRPTFVTRQVMAPHGAPVPFLSWSIERDWLGAYFWKWAPGFPFLWFYYGVSLVASYAVVGAVLRRMALGPAAAWLLAAAFVVFNVPRHYKTYHHFEHLPQHWIYASLFVDALIWHRFWRERRWSWSLELWRGVCLLGMLWGTGYFWGPLVLEWVVVRLALGAGFVFRRPRIEGAARSAALAVGIMILMSVVDIRWFVPLVREVNAAGKIWQPVWWYATLNRVLEPLWATWIVPKWGNRAADFETVVTIGWTYLIPVVLVAWKTRLRSVAPFAAVLFLYVLYIREWPIPYQAAIQKSVPFMEYFRVASRMGLFLPVAAAAIIALGWPELMAWARRRPKWVLALFALVVAGELPHLARPISAMEPMPEPLQSMLGKLRDSPGDTVLDLPFCVAGGNGICTTQQCPNYPRSTISTCLRLFHEKKTHGLYQARMTEAHCRIYDRLPYLSWFDAWKNQRCLNPQEWGDFCAYLDQQPELAGILLHPDVWTAADRPECRRELERRLGPPVAEASFPMSMRYALLSGRGAIDDGGKPSRVRWYRPKCGGAGAQPPN